MPRAIRDKVMSNDRPAEATDRAIPRHWEGLFSVVIGGGIPVTTGRNGQPHSVGGAFGVWH
jgi:hypothetical protein